MDPPEEYPFLKFYQIDGKKNLAEVNLNLKEESYELEIEKLEIPLPNSPPFRLNRSRHSFGALISRHSSSSSATSSSSAPSTPKSSKSSGSGIEFTGTVELSSIKEIRATEFDPRCVNAEALKRLKHLNEFARRYPTKFRLMVILHGSDFNLKRSSFLVIEEQVKKDASDGKLEVWISQLRDSVRRSLNLSYWEKFDLWTLKQFRVAGKYSE